MAVASERITRKRPWVEPISCEEDLPVWELLNNPVFLVFAPATIVPVVAIVASCWTKARRDAQESALKMEMIQRGLSADEIATILEAPRKGRRKDDCRRPADERVHEPVSFVRR